LADNIGVFDPEGVEAHFGDNSQPTVFPKGSGRTLDLGSKQKIEYPQDPDIHKLR
jgi:hypothetical protein